jgi:hypothetical protein
MSPSGLWGLVAGLGTAFYLFALYSIEPILYIQPVIIYSTWLIFILCMVIPLLIHQSKRPLGFKDALKVAFTTYIIGNAIYYLFDYTMLTYWAPELIPMMEAEFRAAAASGMLESLQKEAKNIDFSPGISHYLLTFAQSLIVGFIVAAALALLFKNKS